jgi:type I restriction enzyme S subunit
MGSDDTSGAVYSHGFDWEFVQYPPCKIEDFAALRYGKGLVEANRRPGTVPMYGTNGRCGWHDTPIADGPGLILGRKGQGHLGVHWCDTPFWVIDTAYRVEINRILADLKWFYYAVSHVGLNHLKTGEKPGLPRELFLRQLFPFPPLAEQRAIAGVLGALDDKIAANRRLGGTLEALARRLFRSWFVDFDPVVAKAAGRRPVAVPEVAAKLFPATFTDSPLGPIPTGWRAGTVGECFRVTMGQSPPGTTYNEIGEGLPFYQGRTDFTVRFPTRRVYCTAPTRYADAKDTLVSVRAPVGDINMALERCTVGRGLASVRHKSGSSSFTYYSMDAQREAFEEFEGHGTLFGAINGPAFAALKCVVPADELIAAFDSTISSLDARIETTERQSRTLASLRDALLPRLLSGELRVRDAGKLAGEVL